MATKYVLQELNAKPINVKSIERPFVTFLNEDNQQMSQRLDNQSTSVLQCRPMSKSQFVLFQG